MKQHINKLLLIVVSIVLCCASCVDEYESNFKIDKPEDVNVAEYINSFNVLKEYVDFSTNPNFKLGTGVSATDFAQKKTAYSLALSNFDEVTSNSGTYHTAIVGNDGTMDYQNFQNFVLTAKDVELPVYGNTLCWHANQNYSYLNGLIADIIVPGYTEVLIDFESDEMGKSYTMTGNSTATTVEDPKGESGKVLQVGTDAVKANQSFPKLEITLPEGKTLGDAVTLILDFNGTGSTGLHGSGMRMAINDNDRVAFGSPNSFGCSSGNWGRGLIRLPFENLKLTDEEKALTSFTLTVGSGTGTGFYYIDNISINWVGKTIVKTPEEKKEIFDGELDKFINGMMKTSEGYVKAWDAISEPMSDNDEYMLRSAKTESNTSGNFYWQDYLGDNYARYVVSLARKYHEEFGGNASDLKLFVNESGLETPDSRKCERLVEMITQWEKDGTKFDGIGTQMRVNYSLDATQQAKNEAAIDNMFGLLAASGKLIKVSELTMSIVQANGVPLNEVDVTNEHTWAISEYYNYIVRKYFETIPAAQRYGITVWNPIGRLSLWNSSYNRLTPYTGFAEGLQGKNVTGYN